MEQQQGSAHQKTTASTVTTSSCRGGLLLLGESDSWIKEPRELTVNVRGIRGAGCCSRECKSRPNDTSSTGPWAGNCSSPDMCSTCHLMAPGLSFRRNNGLRCARALEFPLSATSGWSTLQAQKRDQSVSQPARIGMNGFEVLGFCNAVARAASRPNRRHAEAS